MAPELALLVDHGAMVVRSATGKTVASVVLYSKPTRWTRHEWSTSGRRRGARNAERGALPAASLLAGAVIRTCGHGERASVLGHAGDRGLAVTLGSPTTGRATRAGE